MCLGKWHSTDSYIQECEDWMLGVSIEQSTIRIHNISICVQFSSLYISYVVLIQLNTRGLELEMREPLHWLMQEWSTTSKHWSKELFGLHMTMEIVITSVWWWWWWWGQCGLEYGSCYPSMDKSSSEGKSKQLFLNVILREPSLNVRTSRSNVLDNSPRDKILLFGASSVAWFRWWGAIEPKFIHRSIAWHCWTSGAARNPLCIIGMPTRHTLRIPRRARFQSNSPALYNPW